MLHSDDHQVANIASAVIDFRRARQKASMERLIGALTGRSTELIPYDEVRKHLRPLESANRQLQDIPLSSIVGSVNRYTDFSRSFLPRHESDQARWARVRAGIDTLKGLPPIEVYQVGEVYFVLDGHHRVSVARQLGQDTIHAYVTQVYTRVSLSPGDRPDDLILKAEYTDFLAQTHIDELRPGADLMLTAPGQYPKLVEHISAHRYLQGIEEKREVPQEEAVAHWYDTVYLPVIRLIEERNMLRDFPDRTPADLYLWIMENRSELGGHQLGWEAPPETVVEYLRARFGQSAEVKLPRMLQKLQTWLTPEPLEPGPPVGAWRREHFNHPHRDNRMFDELLVTVPGKKGWPAVEMALAFARHDEARLTGLHVIAPGERPDSASVKEIEEEFLRRCEASGVAGRLIVESGSAARILYERSIWMDLVTFSLDYPPPTRPLARLRSGIRTIIRRSSAPLLAVPEGPVRLERAMLAYSDGSKADEALYMAAYLANRWKLALTVISVSPRETKTAAPLERARQYLEEHGVQASYIEESGDPARLVSLSSEASMSDLIIMGGYESGVLRESVRGSTVDSVLRTIHRPVLICS